MTKVEITGGEKVNKLVLELPKKEENVLSKGNMKFLKMVRKSAKLMAPRDTTQLATSISIRPTKTKGKIQQYLLQVTTPHAIYQEEGFRPHWAYIRNSSKLPPGLYFVRKNTPFVKPAIEKNLNKFFQGLNKGVGRAISQ